MTKGLICFLSLLLAGSVLYAQTGNEVLGDNAASAITTGDHNVVIGSDAAPSLSEGSNNVLLGHTAGELADPNNAVVVGTEAGRELASTATGTTFIGRDAGTETTTGYDNTFLGLDAGEANTTGYSSLFLGEAAGRDNTTGYENVFIGRRAAQGSDVGFRSVFIGTVVAIDMDDGWGNVGVGFEASNLLSNAVRSTAIGHGAHHNIRDAVAATNVGSWAASADRNGDFSVAIGTLAARRTGRFSGDEFVDRNTNVGMAAGYTNERGADNVVVGAFAGSGTWNPADLIETNFQSTSETFAPEAIEPTDSNTIVFRSTVLGAQSRGFRNESIAIGYRSQSLVAGGIAFGNNAQATHNNSMVIGASAISQADNTLLLGTDSLVSINPDADGVTALGSATARFASVPAEAFVARADTDASATVDLIADAGTDVDDRWQLRADDGGTLAMASFASGSSADRFSASSDGNVVIADKVDVFSDGRLKQDITSIEDALGLLGQIEGRSYEWRPELHRERGRQYGVIAQDVEAVLPEIVHTHGETGIKSVNYQALVPILINGIKDQQAVVESQDDFLQARADLIANNQSLIDQQAEAIQQIQAQLKKQQGLLEQLTKSETSANQIANHFVTE